MPESLDGHRAMKMIDNIRSDGVQVALTVALMAACAVNLLLLYAWL